MKLSLADLILEAVERSRVPVETDFLVRMAYAEEYRPARKMVEHNLKLLRLNGYIKPHKTGKGNRPSSWVPTAK